MVGAFFLSIATVCHHLAHILTKTGTTNRAAFAQRHGLV